MPTLVTARRSGTEQCLCSNAAPRLKPNELRAWLTRSFRLLHDPAELPNRSDLEETLSAFELTVAEHTALLAELEHAVSVLRSRTLVGSF